MSGEVTGLDMNEVLEKLYLGSEMAVDAEELRKLGVTHILTVCHRPLPTEQHAGFKYLYVSANDVEDADLLTRLSDCFRFIEEGRQQGGVLVHCVAGLSRSATVVIAYVMMKTEHRSLDEALDFVSSKRHSIKPNFGFLEQLHLFEAMGSEVNPQHPHYVNYRIQMLALKVQRGAKVNEILGDLHEDPLQQSRSGQQKASSFFKCRKCRRPLFRRSGILPHSQGAGDAAFDWRSQQSARGKHSLIGQEELCQRSLFIEPVEWMRNDILAMEGKIICPKCCAKLGSYNWFGERCPCGTWVTPAFHVQTAKVDECKITALPTTPS
ncbi:dual specificity protein phosphatase 12-like [Liolophura sinensis]|uniref:dual specificity protein phosphatase 12-like n=1 Tax=Liolophura sinensis TaxID=3198878 RepID=UPI0031593066